ncbi:hypothetical protein CORC01_10750, partial [Colletotrichum orchidophilum]
SAAPFHSPSRPPHNLSPVALQPTGSGLASQEKLLMHTTTSLIEHPRPVPCHSVPHPPDVPLRPGPESPFIPSVQRDLHQVSLTAPQLGHPGPAYPIAHLILKATRRAAVCSLETCLYLRLLGGAAYYFHPLLRSIEARLHSVFPFHHIRHLPAYSSRHLTGPEVYRSWKSFSFVFFVVETVMLPPPSSLRLPPGSGLLHVAPFVPSQSQSSCIRRNKRYNTFANLPNNIVLFFDQTINCAASAPN